MDTAEVHSCIRETKTEFTSEKMKPESPVSNKSASDKSDNTIPDLSYRVVRLHDYSNKELEEKQNGMGFVMMNLLEENGMGVLFANAEKMDIQEERRLRLEAQRRAEEEHRMRIASESKLQETEKKLQELERLLRENSIEPKITEK